MKLANILKDKKKRNEYLKFAAVGLSTALVDILVMALIIYSSNPLVFSNYMSVFTATDAIPSSISVIIGTGMGFIVSFMANYVLSVFFVYEYGNIGKSTKGFLKFMLLAAIGLIFHTVGEFIGFDILHFNIWIVKIVVSLLIFVFNYFSRKLFIFNIDLIRDDDKTIHL